MEIALHRDSAPTPPIWPKVALGITLIIVIVFGLIDSINHELFMRQSVDISLKMQQLPGFFYYYFWIWTYPAFDFATFFPFVVLFYGGKKEKAIYFLLANLGILLLTETIKVAIHDTRPCFQDVDLGRRCSCSFGMVSGHASMGFVFYVLGYLFYFHKKTTPVWRFVGIAAVVFIVGNISVSRLYFGAHSWNQVLMGLLAGLTFTLIILVAKPKNMKILKRILRRTQKVSPFDAFLAWFCFSLFWICHALTALYMKKLHKNFDTPTNLTLVNSPCAQFCYANGAILSHRHIISISRMAPFGFLLLVLFYAKRPATIPNRNFQSEQWKGFGRIFSRFLVFSLMLWPIVASNYVSKIMPFLMSVFFNWILGLAFCLLFVLTVDNLLGCFKANIDGDFFMGGDYRPLGFEDSDMRETETDI